MVVVENATIDHPIDCGSNKADLIGPAQVPWADPEWPEKVKQGKENDMDRCSPNCGIRVHETAREKDACFLGPMIK